MRTPVARVRDEMAEPIFILATPRSMSSVACAMLGRHPQLFGLPETHLFGDETVQEWWVRCSRESFGMAHGLLRAVAEICYGEQTEASVRSAAGWLRRRSGHTSGMLFEELALRVHPLALVDKSPNMVYSLERMHRVLRFFPAARFIHLVRHPRAYCTSVLHYRRTLSTPEYSAGDRMLPTSAPQWIADLASFPYSPQAETSIDQRLPELDPQGGWFVLNSNAAAFVAPLGPEQAVTVRVEELVSDPGRAMAGLATWLRLRSDDDAVEAMMRPELSPFARFGPPTAHLGNDIFFLEQPELRPGRARPQSLDGPLDWRQDGAGFLPEVVDLAKRFGYT
jgi:hypothetical protein